jgi:tetratricopeptide (TPR) repeat protein
MPKRDIQVISHSSATNHRIVATPDEPFPDITFKQTTNVLPDLIHLDPPPGLEGASLSPLTLLQAYGELAADKPNYVPRYLALLTQLEKTLPDNVLVQAAVGRRELKSGNFDVATDHLRRALELAPPEATTCADLADALSHLERKNEAVTWLDKSIELDPFNPFTQRTLIARLIDLKQYARARAALEHYVEVFPQDTFMRQMLAKARAQPVQ